MRLHAACGYSLPGCYHSETNNGLYRIVPLSSTFLPFFSAAAHFTSSPFSCHHHHHLGSSLVWQGNVYFLMGWDGMEWNEMSLD